MPYQPFEITNSVGNGSAFDDEYRPEDVEIAGISKWESTSQMPWEITVYATDAALDTIESNVPNSRIGERVYPDPDPWS